MLHNISECQYLAQMNPLCLQSFIVWVKNLTLRVYERLNTYEVIQKIGS